MDLYNLDGLEYLNLVKAGAYNLINDVDRINMLNVFPVPDGDTGTNMRLSIEGGIKDEFNDIKISSNAKKIARGMVLAARGNSGVILSQFFYGLSKGVDGFDTITPKDFAKALLKATERSYRAVETPTEGTILTVMRESGEYLNENLDKVDTFIDLFNLYIERAKISLENTPNLLPVLKKAGVVDSGGAGLILVLEGMLKYLNGEKLESILKVKDTNSTNNYYSGSAVQNDTGKKVHKKYATVAVANGRGLLVSLKEMGVDIIVSGGQTMNTSTQDFIDAFNCLDADNIFVFPNNGNILLAAQQAANNYDKANIIVIPTKTLVEGYSACSMLNFDSDNLDEIKSELLSSFENLSTLEVTYSVRDCVINDVDIKKGDYISLYDGELISSNKMRIEALKEAFKGISDIEDKAIVTLIVGSDVDDSEVEEIKEFIKSLNSYIEIYPVRGEQDIYSYIIGLE